jgi:hypothetical protein
LKELSPRDIELLKIVMRQPDKTLNLNDPALTFEEKELLARVKTLSDNGLVKEQRDASNMFVPAAISMTTQGKDYLLALEDSAQRQREEAATNDTKEKDQKLEEKKKERKRSRHDYLVATFSAGLGFIFGVISTLLFEHYAGVNAFIDNLFH